MKTSLILKTLQFCLAVYLNMAVIKYFPLIVIGISANCAPFLVMIFAYLCLPSDPRVNLREFCATLLAVIGTTLIIVGNTETNRA